MNFREARGNLGYNVQATVNMGWCGSGGDEWIRDGDYHNTYANTFQMQAGENEVKRDILTVRYNRVRVADVQTFESTRGKRRETVLINCCNFVCCNRIILFTLYFSVCVDKQLQFF